MDKVDIYIIENIKKYKSLAQIGRELNLSRQAISRRSLKLRDEGWLYKVGGSIYRVNEGKELSTKGVLPTTYSVSTKKRKKPLCRPHAFEFTIDVPKGRKRWAHRKEILKKRKIKPYRIGNAYWEGQGFIFKGQIIHFNPQSITIKWKRGDYILTYNGVEGRRVALFRLYDILNALEILLGFSLKTNYEWRFRTSSQHFAKLESPVADHYKEQGRILQVRGRDNKIWALVDFSMGEDRPEIEMIDNKEAPADHDGFDDVMNDLREHGFKTISERLEEAKADFINEVSLLLSEAVDGKGRNVKELKRLDDYDKGMWG